MFCESRRPRIAVAVLCVVPVVLGVSCASKSDADLFDSTPQATIGSPSTGGARSSSGGAGSSLTGGQPSTGGAAPSPVPAQGGTTSVTPEPSGGAAGATTGTGGVSEETGGTSSGGQATPPTGGKAATGGASGSDGGTSSGGTASGGTATGGSATGGKAACVSEPELCDGVDNDCDSELDEQACADGCEGFTLEGRRYMFCDGEWTATEAHESCRDEGMHLAWIESEQENGLLLEQLATFMDVRPDAGFASEEDQAQVRLGGSDQEDEGVWRWEQPGQSVVFWEQLENADEPWEGAAASGYFANWSEERPNGNRDANEDCVVMEIQDGADGDAGQWNDVRCSAEHPFVCERP